MLATKFEEPLFGKYDLRSKLKVGGFGSVYRAKAVSASDTNLYAIKVMPKKHVKYAEIEHKLYQTIKKAEFTMGFVKHYQYGNIGDNICLTMELVGSDLDELMARNKSNKFSAKTGLMIALQAIDRIQAIHTIGYLHRDIKPDNFTIGLKEKSTLIYLIDFGLCKKISAPLLPEEKKKIIGTLAYMSCNNHEGKEPGILDDIESFVYTIVYLINGTLPWMSINIQSPADYHRILLMKQKLNKSWFAKCGIPIELYEILELAKNSKRNAKFDYLKIKYKLMNGLAVLGTENDFEFDWSKRNQTNRGGSSQRILEKDLDLKKMKEDNQKIVAKEIYEIYKFMDKEEKAEQKKEDSPKKIREHPRIEAAERQKKMQNKAKEDEVRRQQKPQTANKQKRPASSNQRPGSAYREQNKLQKQLRLIESMRYEGPRIVINRTAVHKI